MFLLPSLKIPRGSFFLFFTLLFLLFKFYFLNLSLSPSLTSFFLTTSFPCYSRDLESFHFYHIDLMEFSFPYSYFLKRWGEYFKFILPKEKKRNEMKTSGFWLVCGPHWFFFCCGSVALNTKKVRTLALRRPANLIIFQKRRWKTVWTINYCGWEKEFDWRLFSLETDREAPEIAIVFTCEKQKLE